MLVPELQVPDEIMAMIALAGSFFVIPIFFKVLHIITQYRKKLKERGYGSDDESGDDDSDGEV